MGALGRGGVLLPHEGDVANLSIAYEEGICRSSGFYDRIGGCRIEGARSARAPPMLCDVFTPDICAADRRKVTPHSTFEKLDDLLKIPDLSSS